MTHAPLSCTLLTIPNELIAEVLGYLPVETILNIEKTCKTLYQLCQARPIWSSSMQSLDIYQAPYLHPFQTVESLSTSDLKRKVVGALQRQQNWHAGGRIHPKRLLELPLPHITEDKIVKTRLLPGGSEILLAHDGYMELWSFESQECYWVIPPPGGRATSVSFEVEFVQDGAKLVVAIACEENELIPSTLLQIYSYEIASRRLVLVFESRLPPTVVVNWKTNEALIIDFVDPMGQRIDTRARILADNHLIVFMHQADTGFCAFNVPLTQLTDSWSSNPDYTTWAHIPFRPHDQGFLSLSLPLDQEEQEPPLIEDATRSIAPYILTHRVFTPTWKKNAPTEILVAAYTSRGHGDLTRLRSFRLQLSRSNPIDSASSSGDRVLSLVTSSCIPVNQLPRQPRSISNSGLMFSLHQQLHCFSLFPGADVEQPVNELQIGPSMTFDADETHQPNISTVDPWSGAIAVRMPGIIRVLQLE